MADNDLSGPEADPGFLATMQARLARWTNYAGAAMSLGLVIGIGVWGTKIILRDVGDIPVVLAAEGPMRMAPERPGGRPADHQGLSVNAVAGTGTASKPADTLRLAPSEPDLTEEDVAFAEIAPPPAPSGAVAPGPLPTLAELTASSDDPETAIRALADQLAEGAAPLSDLSEDTVAEAETAEATPEEREAAAIDRVVAEALGAVDPAEPEFRVIPASVPGVSTSRRPALRPVALANRIAAAAPPSAPDTREIAADQIAEGTRLVQFGAFDSPETAREEWSRLAGRFSEYLDGHDRVIERASSGGKIFYRLRAHGFDSLSDARRFCAAFVAGNADCIPVVAR
ncbi:Sporulation related domain protein [Roseivivax jejudonensis]|uniref:Sporulation related domain protein n=1 Tax=Roseivivax jejudonensis TaxID=1529041 RepID=A0A1X6YTY0_9RHOB|nr:SPOR domain-containing protein [Roseivivax jejudonensis]SLN29223.1 Sporulation related domain protein [Roseivivax jejudonensis]